MQIEGPPKVVFTTLPLCITHSPSAETFQIQERARESDIVIHVDFDGLKILNNHSRRRVAG